MCFWERIRWKRSNCSVFFSSKFSNMEVILTENWKSNKKSKKKKTFQKNCHIFRLVHISTSSWGWLQAALCWQFLFSIPTTGVSLFTEPLENISLNWNTGFPIILFMLISPARTPETHDMPTWVSYCVLPELDDVILIFYYIYYFMMTRYFKPLYFIIAPSQPWSLT